MADLFWNAYGNSDVAHLVDEDGPKTKRSGQRAACGRYPGRNFAAWFSLSLEDAKRGLAYNVTHCEDCAAISRGTGNA